MTKRFALSKYTEDGSLDSSFGGDGRVVTNFSTTGHEAITDLAVDSQGRILVGGWGGDDYFALARYHPDGDLDNDFDHDGKVLTGFSSGRGEKAYSLTVDSQDRPIAAGRIVIDIPFSIWPPAPGKTLQNFALARYETDGNLDNDFHNDGKVITRFTSADTSVVEAVTVDGSDRVVVAGAALLNGDSSWRFALARYLTNGNLDTSFDNDGKVLTNFPGGVETGFAVAVDSAGRIVVAGSANKRFALARYDTDGSLDTSFHNDGKVVTNFSSATNERALAVAIDSSDRVVVAGYARVSGNNRFALTRYDTDGGLDTSFDNDGKVLLDFTSSNSEGARSIAIDGQGRIVTGGWADVNGRRRFALARHTSSGQPDTSFDGDGKVLTSFGSGSHQDIGGIAITDDSSIVAGGWTD